jgi:hypothetical protein
VNAKVAAMKQDTATNRTTETRRNLLSSGGLFFSWSELRFREAVSSSLADAILVDYESGAVFKKSSSRSKDGTKAGDDGTNKRVLKIYEGQRNGALNHDGKEIRFVQFCFGMITYSYLSSRNER